MYYVSKSYVHHSPKMLEHNINYIAKSKSFQKVEATINTMMEKKNAYHKEVFLWAELIYSDFPMSHASFNSPGEFPQFLLQSNCTGIQIKNSSGYTDSCLHTVGPYKLCFFSDLGVIKNENSQVSPLGQVWVCFFFNSCLVLELTKTV